MDGNFIVLRRTKTEALIFGGDVYIDIDGKNVGILGNQDFITNLSQGKHSIRMYKSHTMSSFIGIAENEFEMTEGSPLFARYSPPMIANKPGTIIIANYISPSQLDSLSKKIEEELNSDFKKEEQIKIKREEESQESKNNLIFWIVIMPIVFLVLWLMILDLHK
jgi:hypothetical protein